MDRNGRHRLGLVLPTGAGAQDKPVHLKLSHWVPPTHPLQKAIEDWGASVQKASNGTITYKVSSRPSSSARRSTTTTWRAMASPTSTYINPGYQPGRFPIIAAGELPFLMANAKGGTAGARRLVPASTRRSEMKDVHVLPRASCTIQGRFIRARKKIMVPEDSKA